MLHILLLLGTKLPFALLGQSKQHFAPFPKLIRKMPIFCNSTMLELSFYEELDIPIIELV